jgi:hypothetical protein
MIFSNKHAWSALSESMVESDAAYRSYGFQINYYLGIYYGVTMRPDAHRRLDSELKGQEFTMLQGFLTSLMAQQFFIGRVVPVIGPAMIFLGILLRALPFTRKYGGLLLTIGAGLIIVLPGTYLLAWYSLQVAAYGPQVVSDPPGSECPAECKAQPPYAYNLNAPNQVGVYGSTPESWTYDSESLLDFSRGLDIDMYNEKELLDAGVQTCYPDYKDNEDKSSTQRQNEAVGSSTHVPVEASENCPAICRTVPVHPELNCDLEACEQIPLQCKVLRAFDPEAAESGCSGGDCSCPEFCQMEIQQIKWDGTEWKSIVPTTNAQKCEDNGCDDCPLYCRDYIEETGSLRSADFEDCESECKDDKGSKKCLECALPGDCISCIDCFIDNNDPNREHDCFRKIPAALQDGCSGPGACGKDLAFYDIFEQDPDTGLPKLSGGKPVRINPKWTYRMSIRM